MRQIILLPYKLYLFLESKKKRIAKVSKLKTTIKLHFDGVFVASDAFVAAELKGRERSLSLLRLTKLLTSNMNNRKKREIASPNNYFNYTTNASGI